MGHVVSVINVGFPDAAILQCLHNVLITHVDNAPLMNVLYILISSFGMLVSLVIYRT